MSDHTQQPTSKRRQEAHKAGRVAASTQVGGALLWLTFFVAVLAFADPVHQQVVAGFEDVWTNPGTSGSDPDAVGAVQQGLLGVGVRILPLLAIFVVVSICCRLAQTGFLWVPQQLASGSARPRRSLMDLVFHFTRGLLLVSCLFAGLAWAIGHSVADHAQLGLSSFSGRFALQGLTNWGLRIGLAMLVFAAIDYAYQRYRFERGLAMTPEEVREEVKAIEGDPLVATGRRNLQQSFRTKYSA